MLCRKGSRMLPDFFPLDKQKKETLNHQIIPSAKRINIAKQYSWENDESGESEAQSIAESWMMYFGLETSDSWCCFRNWYVTMPERNSFERECALFLLSIKADPVNF